MSILLRKVRNILNFRGFSVSSTATSSGFMIVHNREANSGKGYRALDTGVRIYDVAGEADGGTIMVGVKAQEKAPGLFHGPALGLFTNAESVAEEVEYLIESKGAGIFAETEA